MSALKNKYLLGGLTLGDLEEKIRGLDVVADCVHYGVWTFRNKWMLLWQSVDDVDPDPDLKLPLDSPVKLEDGKVFLSYAGEEIEMSFGTMKFHVKPIELE
jgi:hypothetical protein